MLIIWKRNVAKGFSHSDTFVMFSREPTASEVEKWKESFNHVMSSESESHPGMFHLNQANINTTRPSGPDLALKRLASGQTSTAHETNETTLRPYCGPTHGSSSPSHYLFTLVKG